MDFMLPNLDALLLFQVFRYLTANRITGDFHQFGVGDGKALAHAYLLMQSKDIAEHALREGGFVGWPMRFHGYGYVSPRAQDTILHAGVPPEDFRLYHSLTGPEPESAAVVYLNLDSKEDVQNALQFVAPALLEGSVIVLNKWWKHPGEVQEGFRAWAFRGAAWLGDLDTHFAAFQDNGWACAFIVQGVV